MNGFGNIFRARLGKGLWRGPFFFGLLLLAVAPVAAKQCPRGQIFRVSKNMCIDKSEAVGLGIVRGPAGAAKPAATPDKAAAKSDEPAATPDKPADVGDGTPSVPVEPAPQSASVAADEPPKPPSSPYGELTLESFAKP